MLHQLMFTDNIELMKIEIIVSMELVLFNLEGIKMLQVSVFDIPMPDFPTKSVAVPLTPNV